MGYHFLTGATGLLGAYLLRDLLSAGVRVAVLARASKLESAAQRIESIMARWDRQCGYALPRPVVFEGHLSDDRLGLDDQALDWVSRNCTAFIHNAASLTFEEIPASNEPRRSNVDGVRHALAFCRRTGIRRFHHVSTAYVCGKRRGRILESEGDEGQEPANVYEQTKLEGEQLVRADDFIEPATVFRPAIIIGDSRTGHTLTFHGFYAPLKLFHTMFRHITLDDVRVAPLLSAMEIEGDERKNLVPVDWVASVMAHVIQSPEHHARTYHLAPRRPVTTEVMRDSMVESFLNYSTMSEKSEGWEFDFEEFTVYFRDQLSVYQSYWNDDPEFDLTNTLAATPHLTCPEVNREMLTRMCKFAIETNFGWPRPAPVVPEFDVAGHLRELIDSPGATGNGVPVSLQVNGRGGGDFRLMVDGGRVVGASRGLSDEASATFYLNSKTFERLAKRQLSVRQSLQTAQLLIEGNGIPHGDLASALQDAVINGPAR